MEVEKEFFCRTGKPKGVRIEVMADSLRVGKTTAVKVIGEGLRKRGEKVRESYEDWQHNPYLKESYSDPARSFLESQKWFAKRKWEQVREEGKGNIIIQDVTPEMDYNYALTNMKLGRMSKQNFREYERFFYALNWEQVPAPSLVVYLTVSDEGLIYRAKQSRREFETVDGHYFLTMKRVNRRWLRMAKARMNVLVIDTDNLDFANQDDARAKFVNMLAENI